MHRLLHEGILTLSYLRMTTVVKLDIQGTCSQPGKSLFNHDPVVLQAVFSYQLSLSKDMPSSSGRQKVNLRDPPGRIVDPSRVPYPIPDTWFQRVGNSLLQPSHVSTNMICAAGRWTSLNKMLSQTLATEMWGVVLEYMASVKPRPRTLREPVCEALAQSDIHQFTM